MTGSDDDPCSRVPAGTLELLCHGRAVEEIARLTFAGNRTTYREIAELRGLAGVDSTRALIAQAVRLGWVSPDRAVADNVFGP
jgi:hypothetical protein